MRILAKGIVSSALGAALMAHGTHAVADQHVFIVLDSTGSMTLDDTLAGNGNSRWHNAISDVATRMLPDEEADFQASTDTNRHYSIWAFSSSLDPDGAGDLDALVQLFPDPDAPGTATGTYCNVAGVVADTDFGVYAPFPECTLNQSDVADFFGEWPTLLETIETANPPAGLTPLADTLCAAVERMHTLSGVGEKAILLQTDGEENFSTTVCDGIPDPNIDEDFMLNLMAPDWGMNGSDAGGTALPLNQVSWQNRVIRSWFAADQTASLAARVGSQLAARPSNTFPPSVRGVRWDVNLLYRTFPSADTLAFQVAGLNLASVEGLAVPRALAIVAALPTTTTSLAAAAASTVPSQSMISIGLNELLFFRDVIGATPGSRYHETVIMEGTVFGVDHALAGDVDDSGCTDIADYQIITQADVWRQRAVLPLEIATRADLNRDGWVDTHDLAVLFDHWGEGCINPVGDVPYSELCFDGAQNSLETDVDCGGACPDCLEGEGCLADADCDSSSCMDDFCAAPACDDGVQNGDENDVDCGGSVCEPCPEPPGGLNANLFITNDWGTGYCAQLQLENPSATATTDWTVSIDTQMSQLFTQWGAAFSAASGAVDLAPFGYSAVIQPGATSSAVGFCANRVGSGGDTAVIVSASGSF